MIEREWASDDSDDSWGEADEDEEGDLFMGERDDY